MSLSFNRLHIFFKNYCSLRVATEIAKILFKTITTKKIYSHYHKTMRVGNNILQW